MKQKNKTRQVKLPVKTYNKLKNLKKKDEFYWQVIERLLEA